MRMLGVQAQGEKPNNNPMHSSQPFGLTSNFRFSEITLTRRAKQGHYAITRKSESPPSSCLLSWTCSA